MRNLKKILALVLALVMSMSLVTIANAADFTDNDDISYEEAADVMNAIGIIEGFEDGSFDPDGTLTREQAATLVTRMLLGDNADRLGIESSTFNDVAMTRWSAPYIEYCASLGLIDGAGDGNFYPAGQLTGYAFAKILLTALGYSSEKEGLTGPSWSVNVAALAMEVGLDNGLESGISSAVLTREEAAQMALNAIKSPLVAYDNDATVIVNGAEVSIGGGNYYYVTTTLAREQRISEQRLSNTGEYTVEFGERYFPLLVLKSETDAFGRPSHTWSYDGEEIGTYVDYDLRRGSYTSTVEGADIYSDIGSAAAEYDLTYFINGIEQPTSFTDGVSAKLTRRNDDTIGTTGNGVLTEVFVDTDAEELIITEIHTYLAKVNADYNTRTERLSLTVYYDVDDSTPTKPTEDTLVRSVSGEDFAVEDYQKDDMVMVTYAGEDREIQTIRDPEVVSEVTITAYSTYGRDDNQNAYMMKSVTADGEKYDASKDSAWQAEYLYDYTLSQMKDFTWNLYLDSYGYVLGLENVEASNNYAFLVGYQTGSDVLATAIDKALVITIDENNNATMSVVEAKDNEMTEAEHDQLFTVGGSEKTTFGAINKWVTYEMDGDVMVLKTCVDEQIHDTNTSHPVSTDWATLEGYRINSTGGYTGTSYEVAYGNSSSVYVAVDADTSVNDGTGTPATSNGSIVKINGTTVGIKNTSIDKNTSAPADAKGSYVLYDEDDGYVKYAIVVGEDASIADRLVYLTDGITEKYYDSELDKDIYVYEGIIAGEYNDRILSEVSAERDTGADLVEGGLYEASFDADGIITEMDVKDDNWTGANTTQNKAQKYVQATSNDDNSNDRLDAGDEAIALNLRGATLYITAASNNHYVILDDDCQFYIRGTESNGKRYSEYELITDADNAMAALGNTNEFTGNFVAICDGDTGYATTIIINDYKYEQKGDTPAPTGEMRLSGVKIGGTNVGAPAGYKDIDDAVKNARTVYLSSEQLNETISLTAATTNGSAGYIRATGMVFNDASSVADFVGSATVTGDFNIAGAAPSQSVTTGSPVALGNGNVVVIEIHDDTDVTDGTYFAFIITERN